MSEVLYFAYGSNLLPARLRARCPSARLVGAARLPDFASDYSKRGKDGSGKATVFDAPGSVTTGAVFSLSPLCAVTLDGIEGAGYARRVVDVLVGENEVNCATYVAVDDARFSDLTPFAWYKALIVAGLRHHALRNPPLERARAAADPDVQRHVSNMQLIGAPDQ